MMYDLDLIDEDVFVAWEKKPSKNIPKALGVEIRTASAAFLNWIKEAEEEEDPEHENADGM